MRCHSNCGHLTSTTQDSYAHVCSSNSIYKTDCQSRFSFSRSSVVTCPLHTRRTEDRILGAAGDLFQAVGNIDNGCPTPYYAGYNNDYKRRFQWWEEPIAANAVKMKCKERGEGWSWLLFCMQGPQNGGLVLNRIEMNR